jgi:hypothetical protein
MKLSFDETNFSSMTQLNRVGSNGGSNNDRSKRYRRSDGRAAIGNAQEPILYDFFSIVNHLE